MGRELGLNPISYPMGAPGRRVVKTWFPSAIYADFKSVHFPPDHLLNPLSENDSWQVQVEPLNRIGKEKTGEKKNRKKKKKTKKKKTKKRFYSLANRTKGQK